jgi:hypothetical protein
MINRLLQTLSILFGIIGLIWIIMTPGIIIFSFGLAPLIPLFFIIIGLLPFRKIDKNIKMKITILALLISVFVIVLIYKGAFISSNY